MKKYRVWQEPLMILKSRYNEMRYVMVIKKGYLRFELDSPRVRCNPSAYKLISCIICDTKFYVYHKNTNIVTCGDKLCMSERQLQNVRKSVSNFHERNPNYYKKYQNKNKGDKNT